MDEEEIPHVSPDDLVGEVIEGAELYSNITAEFIKNFVFYEKTLCEWASVLMIKVPPAGELDEERFTELLVELTNNLQKASNYHSAATSIYDALASGGDMKRSDIINAIVQKHKKDKAKRPAGSIIEAMADSYMNSTLPATIAAKIVKTFWKQRVDTLLDVRKLFELLGMNLAVRAKYSQ